MSDPEVLAALKAQAPLLHAVLVEAMDICRCSVLPGYHAVHRLRQAGRSWNAAANDKGPIV